MKKLLTVVMTTIMLIGCFNLTVFAEEGTLSANVYVTISDKDGKLALTQEKIVVQDINKDGELNIDEALYAAHEAKYEGGAAAGYQSYMHVDYGLSLGKLWGDASGNFGYYVNNASAWSLADPVKEGDYINAFVYSDGEYYSDTYCYFDVNSFSTDAGKDISLTLKANGYDADNNWAPIVVAVADATITVDGVKTTVKTDAEGKATIQIADGGNHVISAVSDTQILVPPVCLATVSAANNTNTDNNQNANANTNNNINTDTNVNTNTNTSSPKTGDSTNMYLFMILMTVAFSGIIVLNDRRKKSYEK
ncbi:MAG: LPXTG cell wall anchor domain-containing protein [Tyzzerella sp.]|nr:LPXTG cell wall anchor domain-containing protein [Tyzzerella sp.]